MRRTVVAGGTGFFGRQVVALLRAEGVRPVVAARNGELALDVEDRASLRTALRAGDVVVDAAGPFQARSTALVDVALELGADVIDLNESFEHAERLASYDQRARERGVALLSTCSAVSSVAAALVRLSGIDEPERVSALVAPASRETAHAGTLRALLASVGRPVRIWRDGRMLAVPGWREMREFTLPRRRAHLVSSALTITLPAVWPTLRTVDCWTDTSTPGANALLSVAARARPARAIANSLMPLGMLGARLVGTRRGAFAVEVEGDGRVARLALTSPRRSYLAAVAPAVLAARAIADGTFTERGLVPADRHVSPDVLLPYLATLGITLERS